MERKAKKLRWMVQYELFNKDGRHQMTITNLNAQANFEYILINATLKYYLVLVKDNSKIY
jgi:hypothetical protein